MQGVCCFSAQFFFFQKRPSAVGLLALAIQLRHKDLWRSRKRTFPERMS